MQGLAKRTKAHDKPGVSGNAAVSRLGRPPRGKTLLSESRLIKVALAIVDESGPEALSMRTLAARLGVTAMSLYRYCDSHEALLDELHRRILSEHAPQPVTKDQNYREVLTGMAKALRRAIKAHPKAAILFASRPVRGPSAASYVNAVMGRLIEAGFEHSMAAYLIDAVGAFTVGVCLSEFARKSEASGDDRECAAGPASSLPHLEKLGAIDVKHDYETEFVVGLLALLDGFGSRYAKRAR